MILQQEKFYPNGLGVIKGEFGGVYMIMKTGMEVAQGDSVFNYGPLIPQKDIKSQDRKIVAGLGMKPAPIFFSQVTTKRTLGRKPP